MMDAAKLDKIEQRQRGMFPAGFIALRVSDAREMITGAREAIALHAAVEAHNARIIAECGVEDVPNGRGQYRSCQDGKVLHYNKQCSTCPRRYMIDLPGSGAAP